jgi:hypothetical protein
MLKGLSAGGGAGGAAAAGRTVLIGPLKADAYRVQVGRGGQGGEATWGGITRNPADGVESAVSGSDVNLVFAAGSGAKLQQGRGVVAPEARRGEEGPFGKDSGGPAGNQNADGENAKAACAGGGGSGRASIPSKKLHGGDGGGGVVIIQPLPDFDRLFKVLSGTR